MQQGWYEDEFEKYQYPYLDTGNKNFMKRRSLFLTDDGAEFSLNLVTFTGRLHLDIGTKRYLY